METAPSAFSEELSSLEHELNQLKAEEELAVQQRLRSGGRTQKPDYTYVRSRSGAEW